MPRPLVIIPTYLATEKSADLTATCVQTLAATAAGDVDCMIIDDCSPREDLWEDLKTHAEMIGVECWRKPRNSGFSHTINHGLKTALKEGRDAILCNADIQFFDKGWAKALINTDAYLVGSLLIYPTGLIQHAGIYWSVLNRDFFHIYAGSPATLPEANVPRTCPVTGALQLIRYESLALVGIYDERFKMSYEDVDYAIRVFNSGRTSVFQPGCKAIHHESAIRGPEHETSPKLRNWHKESKSYLYQKHAGKSFHTYMPLMLGVSQDGLEQEAVAV